MIHSNTSAGSPHQQAITSTAIGVNQACIEQAGDTRKSHHSIIDTRSHAYPTTVLNADATSQAILAVRSAVMTNRTRSRLHKACDIAKVDINLVAITFANRATVESTDQRRLLGKGGANQVAFSTIQSKRPWIANTELRMLAVKLSGIEHTQTINAAGTIWICVILAKLLCTC